MKKFTIFTDRAEFSFSPKAAPSADENEIRNWYLDQDGHEPHMEAQYNDEAEARAAFARDFSEYGRARTSKAYGRGELLLVELAYLEEAEYTEDGEYDQGGDWIADSVPSYTAPADEEDNTMKIINTITGETVREIITNHSMSLDDAINLVGSIHPENENENVEIDGNWYYYDDLDMVW